MLSPFGSSQLSNRCKRWPAPAPKHPRFAEFVALYYMLPTANPKHYEVSCYLRYLALASMGGGWMVDYAAPPLRPLWLEQFGCCWPLAPA